jgi:hypothetical protein
MFLSFSACFLFNFSSQNMVYSPAIKERRYLPSERRFLNHSKFNWRRFLTLFSTCTLEKVDKLTDSERPKVLIVDDSMYDRDRSKKLELLARCMDHSSLKKRYYKGFRMLTLGWSDSFTFMPLDFPY